MGNFFTSTQIYNTKQLDREQFISFFCEEMKKNGYVPGNSDESEVSYIFRFADDCKWVTITSEDYDGGNQLSQTDTSRLAKMLKTTCINTTVIDSDCAVMEMYNKSGQKADTLIMGRADDCFGDEIPQPSMKAWKPFLAEGRSWEQFCDIVQESESYTFIEDGLSELATVIGMDESEILFHASVAEEDEQTVFLYFTKAAAKEKKLTLKAAFIKVFGEALEPLGFIKTQSRHPYFVRVVNEDILNIITFDKDSRTEFGIYGGIATLYRKQIDLDRDVIDNIKSMNDTAQFYYFSNSYKSGETLFKRSYSFIPDNSNSLIHSLTEAALHVKQYIIPVINNIMTLRDCVDYFMLYQSPLMKIILDDEDRFGDNEGLLYFKIDDHSDMTHEFLEYLDCHKKFTNYDVLLNQAEEYRKKQIQKRDEIYNDNKKHQEILSELSFRRKINIDLLKGYGIIESQNEKKLTLKAAFIKVFGEALEPLGFKLVKSKYPYYLRVVGEGIIQGFSVSKEKSFDCDPNEEGFSIYVGVSLLSLPLINFDKNPAIIDNQQWMISLNELYRRFLVYLDEFNEECKEYSLFYKKGKSEEMLDTLRKSRYEFMPFVLEYLEKLKTLEDIYQAGDILPGINDDAIILLDRIDEQIEKIKKNLPEKIKMLESVHANNPASFEVLKEHYIKNHEKRIKRWTSLKKGGEAYDDYMKTAEKTKEKNMRVMENLGVIPKKG